MNEKCYKDTEGVACLLWPDSTEAQAHTNLRKVVYQLRQTFPHADSFLRISRHSPSWQPGTQQIAWTLDVQDFEWAVAQAEQAEHIQNLTAMRQALVQAVELYRGDLLPGCYWAARVPKGQRRERLCEHRIKIRGRTMDETRQ